MERIDGTTAWLRRTDERRDKVALAGATLAVLALFFTVSAIHMGILGAIQAPDLPNQAPPRLVINLGTSALFVLLLAASRLHVLGGPVYGLAIPFAAALIAGVARVEGLTLIGVLTRSRDTITLAELFSGTMFCFAAAILGRRYMVSQSSLRAEERRRAFDSLQRELALRALENEEIKVRRSIAEGLHGSLQQRLVILSVRLDELITQARALGLPDSHVEVLEDLRDDVERTREDDVRTMSRMLYPEGLDVGVVPAVRMLLRRLPASIATRLEVDDALRALDDPGASQVREADRLLIVRVVEEGVTNALRHGHATRFEVTLGLEDDTVSVEVCNNGELVDTQRFTEGSGVHRLRGRVGLVGGTIDLIDDLHRPGADTSVRREVMHVHLLASIPLGRDPGDGALPALPDDRMVKGFGGPEALLEA